MFISVLARNWITMDIICNFTILQLIEDFESDKTHKCKYGLLSGSSEVYENWVVPSSQIENRGALICSSLLIIRVGKEIQKIFIFGKFWYGVVHKPCGQGRGSGFAECSYH